MTAHYDTFSTAAGTFSVAVNETGAVIATTFGDAAELRRRLKPGHWERGPKETAVARRELTEFFRGERQKFTVKVDPTGTEFQMRVWAALRRIPYGQTRSYGQLAAEVGNPKASRAVGRANGTNPVCPIIPCHRCIGADGSLTGFGFGEPLKRWLLDLESGATRGHYATAPSR